MKDKFNKLKQKLSSPATQRTACYFTGVFVGSFGATYYIRTRPHILDLSKEGYEALISGEANNFRMSNAEHSFKIICEY